MFVSCIITNISNAKYRSVYYVVNVYQRFGEPHCFHPTWLTIWSWRIRQHFAPQRRQISTRLHGDIVHAHRRESLTLSVVPSNYRQSFLRQKFQLLWHMWGVCFITTAVPEGPVTSQLWSVGWTRRIFCSPKCERMFLLQMCSHKQRQSVWLCIAYVAGNFPGETEEDYEKY
jgi:hypothetical protein